MFKLKQIFKVLQKYKTSTWLTIISLVISFLGIFILTLYVSFEKSFDKFNLNSESVYRFETRAYGSSVPAVTAGIVQKTVPEIEKQVVLWFDYSKTTTPKLKETNVSFEASGLWAGDQFFNIFTYPLQFGDQATALTEPNTIVLTQSLSRKLFGEANPVGEIVIFRNVEFRVTGLMNDFPQNSSFSADCLPSLATFIKNGDMGVNDWSEWSYNIFLKLQPGADPLNVITKIEQIPDISETVKEMKAGYPDQSFLFLRPLAEIHFVSDGNYKYANPVILNVFIFLACVLFIMGTVNFINFSTSQAPLRAKSLSVSRVLGGKRISAMTQVMSESVLLSIIALAISLGIYSAICNPVESFFNIKGIALGGRYIWLLWFFLFAILFGVVAGYYPSHYVTSTPLAESVKGAINFSGKGKTLRNVLMSIQFIFTIALISSAFIIEKQLNFWRNFDLGINKEHVVYIKTTNELQKHYQTFADELMKNSDIVDYTYSQFIPGSVYMGWGRDVEGQHIELKCWPVDDRFLDFFGIKVTQGRNFIKGSEADINTFILNEKAVQVFGWANPLERKIDGFDFLGQVIGVAKDINFSSLKEPIGPMQFWLTNTRKSNLILRLKPGNYTQTSAYIKNIAARIDSKNPVEVKFLDDSLNLLYDKEEKMSRFIEFVALWCMLLAVTGLLGLVVFICRDRTKEIGVRKVNGATISEILVLINLDFIKWVAISFVVAVPIAWYGMSKWVESFAYKTTLSWWVFALAGLLALLIAILTVTVQSYKAATRNPVEALRYE